MPPSANHDENAREPDNENAHEVENEAEPDNDADAVRTAAECLEQAGHLGAATEMYARWAEHDHVDAGDDHREHMKALVTKIARYQQARAKALNPREHRP